MNPKISEHTRMVGFLSFITLLLASCGASPEHATENADESAPPVTTTTATPSPIDVIAEPDVVIAPQPSASPTEPQPNAAVIRKDGLDRRGARTAPAPAPLPTATSAADPHADHDMSDMSEEDMKAMGHD